jgi:P4 family phage/plasmid primase-like protien
MKVLGFAEPIKAASGNGFHLNYRLEDLPNEEAIAKGGGLIQRCLAAIAAKAGNGQCKVDLAVYNAARIWKLYGTWARKGDSTADRPHRQSYLFAGMPNRFEEVPATPREAVERLSAMAPVEPGRTSATPAISAASLPSKVPPPRKGKTERIGRVESSLGKLKVDEYLRAYEVGVHSVEHKGSAAWYILEQCVFNPDHKAKDAAIIQDDDGVLRYKCFHESCQGHRWPEARALISGDDPLKKFHKGYDPNWKPQPQQLGTGLIASLAIEPVDVEGGAPGLPTPVEIDPEEFFEIRGTNGRPAFVPNRLVKYMAAYFAPLAYTDGVFWRYQGGVWKIFKDGKIKRAIQQALDDKVQADWIRNGLQILGAMVNREEEEWPRRPWLINVKNGMVDLSEIVQIIDEGGQVDWDEILKPHNPVYGSRCQLPVHYDPDAACDLWIRTLWDIFPEGRDKVKPSEVCLGDRKMDLLQQFAGYMLLPNCKYERALLMIGRGGNGKSTVIETLTALLGTENCCEMNLDDLARPFNIPSLQGKMLVSCSEMTHREPTAISMLKKCVSGDRIGGETKFKPRVEFNPYAKFMFSLNEIPSIVDRSYGLSRKLSVLNFNQRFEDSTKDNNRREDLKRELDGIFYWTLRGAIDLMRQGRFVECEEIREEKSDFLATANPLAMFNRECLDVGLGYKVGTRELYQRYVNWCVEGNLKPLGKINFHQALPHILPDIRRHKMRHGDNSVRDGYSGIALKTE